MNLNHIDRYHDHDHDEVNHLYYNCNRIDFL